MSSANPLIKTAEEILAHSSELAASLTKRSIAPPSLAFGADTELWRSHDDEIEANRSAILGLTQRLECLLNGPHGFLHEYVSTNWEYGALYTLLEFNVLEKLRLDGGAVPVSDLGRDTGLPVDKLLRMCRLVACAGILTEEEEGRFAHTAISEALVKDHGLKSFIGFQLFETRIASANLADSLKEPNPFWAGQSAFEYAMGLPMYDWHSEHAEKGKRFAHAMESVSQSLDPGNGMISDFFSNLEDHVDRNAKVLVVDTSAKAGSLCRQLATTFPDLQFEAQDSSSDLVTRAEQTLPKPLAGRITFRQRDPHAARTPKEIQLYTERGRRVVFLLRSVLWCLNDDECIKSLQGFLPALQHHSNPLLLINDLVSPAWGSFKPHVERAYRRRDVTLMTMHNAKQRTAEEWATLISTGCPGFTVTYSEKCTSHSSRGLWVVQRSGNDGSATANGRLNGN